MRLARPLAYVVPLLLGGAGLWITDKLAESHTIFFAGGVAQGLFCGDTGVFDCHQVAAHESSWLWGVPLAYWGLLYFVLVIGIGAAALLLRGADRTAFLALGGIVCGAALLFDVYLAWVMVGRIGNVCLYCVGTYAVNLLLLIGFVWLARSTKELASSDQAALRWTRVLPSWLALRRGSDEDYYGALLKIMLLGLVVTWGASIWRYRTGQLGKILTTAHSQAQAFVGRVESGAAVDVDMSVFAGQPSTGPEAAPLHIAVFGDFQCTFCRTLSRVLDRLQEESGGRIRMTFVNTPNDHACNPRLNPRSKGTEHACWLAAGAQCAIDQGRFWEYHTLLYEDMLLKDVLPERVLEAVAGAGLDPVAFEACVANDATADRVRRDLDLAAACGITSSPALVVNGYRRDGTMLPAALESVVRELLDRGPSNR